MRVNEPSLIKTQLFEAGKGGYATYRIPGIVVTTAGTVLAYCEARKSAKGDWGAIDILMRRSTDGGLAWEEPKMVGATDEEIPKNAAALRQHLANPDEQTHNNPVAIVDHQTKAVHFLFCVEYTRCYYARSDDDGMTFGPPVDITGTFDAYRPDYEWNVLATGPGHGIQLRCGRLLAPVWLSTGTGRHAHRPSVVSVIYSDDHGATWQCGDIVVRHSERVPNPSETVAAQLSDGRVMLNIRSESPWYRRLVSFSADGATGWSQPAFDEGLFEPVCFGSITRLTQRPHHAKDRLLFANPDRRQNPEGPNAWGAWPRKNLTVRLSYDEGQTWPFSKVLEPGISGYSDLAVGPDGTIYCMYEDGGIGGDMYGTAYLTIARLNLEWLTDGADSLAGRFLPQPQPTRGHHCPQLAAPYLLPAGHLYDREGDGLAGTYSDREAVSLEPRRAERAKHQTRQSKKAAARTKGARNRVSWEKFRNSQSLLQANCRPSQRST